MRRRDFDRRVAANLRRAREVLGWTQADLAADLAAFGWSGWTPATVAAVETGKRFLTLDELGALCTVLDVGLPYLLDVPVSFPVDWPTPTDAEPGPGDLDAWNIAHAVSSPNRVPRRRRTVEHATAAAAAHRARELADLEQLVATRAAATVEDIRAALPVVFPGPALDLLGLRDDLAQSMRLQLARKGRHSELSQLRGHATRGLAQQLAEHFAAQPKGTA